ncbi:hypothetical protein Nepgr_024976 [Nepenthes gracilis]|uniref:Transcription repressor n=1 Tax=Nepenthes gracilis TaxID=150966 RepID=A0AAD3T3W6_NEPGR|nr:hypothetical protein Nepgr_024976 [Nepenthes gracilis]
MGNYRFRLSEMLPNAWFYKLQDMSSSSRSRSSKTQTKKHSQFPKPLQQRQPPPPSPVKTKPQATAAAAAEVEEQPQLSKSRKSYYFTRETISQTEPKTAERFSLHNSFPEPSRKSASTRTSRRKSTKSCSSSPKFLSSSASAACSCQPAVTLHSYQMKPECSPPDTSLDRRFLLQFSPDHHPRVHSVAMDDDIIVDVDEKSLAWNDRKSDGLDSISEIEVSPIIIKPEQYVKTKNRASAVEGSACRRSSTDGSELKEHRSSSTRRFSVSTPPTAGVKLRVNSPRIGRKAQGNTSGRRSSVSRVSRRRSISESFAIVKSSFDPQNDFRESMVEMIEQNNIRASKDLEDLLACYLSLNSDEYHDLIIQVFKQIWFDLNGIKQSKFA